MQKEMVLIKFVIKNEKIGSTVWILLKDKVFICFQDSSDCFYQMHQDSKRPEFLLAEQKCQHPPNSLSSG